MSEEDKSIDRETLSEKSKKRYGGYIWDPKKLKLSGMVDTYLKSGSGIDI